MFLSWNGFDVTWSGVLSVIFCFNRGIEAQESGIEGILNRLEKQRSSFLGLGFGEKEDSISSNNNEDKEERDLKTTTDAVSKYYLSSSNALGCSSVSIIF